MKAANAREPQSVDDIHAMLRKRILEEEYYPGQKLSENALAHEFGCSRTPVREALKRLESERLIEVKPQSGAYVKAVTSIEYTDLLEVRAYLEGLAYRLDLEKATDADLSAMEKLVGRMDRAIEASPIDMQGYADMHYKFHHMLVSIAGNELLLRTFEGLNLRSSHMFLRSMNAESAARTQEEHHRIVNDLRARDPKGEKFAIGHLWRKKMFLS